jgi:hypothetical protein
MRDGRRSFRANLAEVAGWFFSPKKPARWLIPAYLIGLAVIIVVVSVWDPNSAPSWLEVKDRRGHEQRPADVIGGMVVLILLASVTVLAVRWKAQLIRLNRRLAHQHTAYYRTQLEREFGRREMELLIERTDWERERDEWRAQMQNETYVQILDQVDRGTLGPRPKSRDDD